MRTQVAVPLALVMLCGIGRAISAQTSEARITIAERFEAGLREQGCSMCSVRVSGVGNTAVSILDPQATKETNDYRRTPIMWYGAGFTEVTYYSAPDVVYAHHRKAIATDQSARTPDERAQPTAPARAPVPSSALSYTDDSMGGIRSEAARTRADSLKLCDSSVTSDLFNCIIASNRVLDDSLNVVYKELLPLLAAAQPTARYEGLIARLRIAQRAWVAFRDANAAGALAFSKERWSHCSRRSVLAT